MTISEGNRDYWDDVQIEIKSLINNDKSSWNEISMKLYGFLGIEAGKYLGMVEDNTNRKEIERMLNYLYDILKPRESSGNIPPPNFNAEELDKLKKLTKEMETELLSPKFNKDAVILALNAFKLFIDKK